MVQAHPVNATSNGPRKHVGRAGCIVLQSQIFARVYGLPESVACTIRGERICTTVEDCERFAQTVLVIPPGWRSQSKSMVECHETFEGPVTLAVNLLWLSFVLTFSFVNSTMQSP